MLSKALLLLAAYGSIYSHDIPPKRYQGDRTVKVHFGSHDEVTRVCGIGIPPPPAGQEYAACMKPNGVIWMQNPCAYASQDYALTMCHELGHRNGWQGNHPL